MHNTTCTTKQTPVLRLRRCYSHSAPAPTLPPPGRTLPPSSPYPPSHPTHQTHVRANRTMHSHMCVCVCMHACMRPAPRAPAGPRSCRSPPSHSPAPRRAARARPAVPVPVGDTRTEAHAPHTTHAVSQAARQREQSTQGMRASVTPIRPSHHITRTPRGARSKACRDAAAFAPPRKSLQGVSLSAPQQRRGAAVCIYARGLV